MYTFMLEKFERYAAVRRRQAAHFRSIEEFGESLRECIGHDACRTDGTPDPGANPADPFFTAVDTLSASIHVSAESLLVEFGEHVVPDVIREFRWWIDAAWEPMELAVYLDQELRRTFSPESTTSDIFRVGDRELRLCFHGNHRVCLLARGIVHGICRLYGLPLTMRADQCRERGYDGCAFTMRVDRRESTRAK